MTVARSGRLTLDSAGVVRVAGDEDEDLEDGREVGHIDDDLAHEVPRELRAELRGLRVDWEDWLDRDRREDLHAEWEATYRAGC